MDYSNADSAQNEASAVKTVGLERSSHGGFLRSFGQIDDQWANILFVPFLAVVLLLRLLWLNVPATSNIFDESFYVNAARVILGWPVPEGAAYADAQPGLDPNLAHLPMAKAIMAGSMFIFGDNPIGWRLPSVVFGVAAVAIIYLLVKRLTKRPWLAFFAAFIFSFDNLVFVHSRIATLDIYMVTLMLLGVYMYVLRRPTLAGGAMALSGLAKFNGVFGLLALIGFELLRLFFRPECRAAWRKTLSNMLLVGGGFVLVFVVGLWGLDRAFTAFQSPIDHLVYMYQFGVSLSQDTPQGIASEPWQWLMNQGVIDYFKQTSDSLGANGQVVSTRTLIDFTGQMNVFIVTMMPLALAALIDALFKKRDALSMLMLSLMVVTYAQPLFTALVYHRISYIFYFLPVLPALCVGIAYVLLDSRVPRLVPAVYTLAVLFGFLMTFPFRVVP